MKFISVSPLVLVPFSLLFLAGCGGNSSGGSSDAGPLDDAAVTPVVENPASTNDSESDASANTDESEGTEDADGAATPPTQTTGNEMSGQFVQFGTINLEYSPSLDETSLFGSFLSFDRAIDASVIEEEVIGVIDTCVVTNVEDIDIDIDFDVEFLDVEFDFFNVSAGEVIPFISQQGSFAELQRSEVYGFTLYNTPGEGDPVAGAPPATLEFSIPGDEFPAFNAIPAQVPEVPELNSPASLIGFGSVNADTLFSWTAASTSGSRVNISSVSLTGGNSVDCVVADDGEFEFPSDTKSELGEFSGFFNTVKRESVSTYRNGNAILVVTRSNG